MPLNNLITFHACVLYFSIIMAVIFLCLYAILFNHYGCYIYNTICFAYFSNDGFPSLKNIHLHTVFSTMPIENMPCLLHFFTKTFGKEVLICQNGDSKNICHINFIDRKKADKGIKVIEDVLSTLNLCWLRRYLSVCFT